MGWTARMCRANSSHWKEEDGGVSDIVPSLAAFKPKFAEPQRPRSVRDMDEMYFTAPDWRDKGTASASTLLVGFLVLSACQQAARKVGWEQLVLRDAEGGW